LQTLTKDLISMITTDFASRIFHLRNAMDLPHMRQTSVSLRYSGLSRWF